MFTHPYLSLKWSVAIFTEGQGSIYDQMEHMQTSVIKQ